MNHFPKVDANRCFPVAEVEAKDFRISAVLFDTSYLSQIGIPADTVKEHGRSMLMVEMTRDHEQSRKTFIGLHEEMPNNKVLVQVNRSAGTYTVPTIFVYGNGAQACLDTAIHKGILTYRQAQPVTAALEAAVYHGNTEESVMNLRAAHRPLPPPQSSPSQLKT